MAQDYTAALAEARTLLRAKPRSPQLNFIAGHAFLRKEEPVKAVAFLRAALAADPEMLEANASLGLALARLGKSAEAIPLLQKALALDRDGSLHYQMVRAYQATGNSEKSRRAMAEYQEILSEARRRSRRHNSAMRALLPPGLVILALALVIRAGAPPIRFREVAITAGVSFVLENCPTERRYLIETIPGGIAVFDYGGDGRPDIFLPMEPKFHRSKNRRRSIGTGSTATKSTGSFAMSPFVAA